MISDDERKKQREKIQSRSLENYSKKMTDENRDMIAQELALMAPPPITVPQCYVCVSERRLYIERMLIQGMSYVAIERHMKQVGEDIPRRSISNHSKEHMAINDAVTRGVMERQADLLGQQYEDGVEGAFTKQGALEILIRKGYQDAVDGITTVEPKDLIQMIRALNEMQDGQGAVAIESAKMQMGIFMEAIQNTTDEWFDDPEEVQNFLLALRTEVQRLRKRDEIEVEVERNLKQLPNG